MTSWATPIFLQDKHWKGSDELFDFLFWSLSHRHLLMRIFQTIFGRPPKVWSMQSDRNFIFKTCLWMENEMSGLSEGVWVSQMWSSLPPGPTFTFRILQSRRTKGLVRQRAQRYKTFCQIGEVVEIWVWLLAWPVWSSFHNPSTFNLGNPDK